MKKTLFIIASIASIFIVSCTKEQVTEIASEDVTAPVGVVYKDGKTYLTINAPEESKVNIVNRVDDTPEDSKRTIFWEEGDKLAWNGVASDELGEFYTPEAHSKSATFTWDGTLERPAKLFTPADFYENYEEDPTIVTLPETGEMTGDDNIVKNNYPMCGTISESGEVTLNPLCAIVRLQIKGTVNKGSISKVEFSGRNEEQIWGDFKVDYTNATLTGQSTAAEFKKVTVTCSKDFSTTEAKYVNIIVPAGTYSNGFQVKIYDNSGKAMVQVKKSETTLTAGKIVSFPVLTFNGVLDIKNADEWNDFAFKYNSSDPDLLANLTTVNIVDNLDFTGKTITTITRPFPLTLEGNEHSFKNVQLTNNAIFTRLGSDGIIQKVKIDGNSKLTVNSEATATYFAPLVADNQGKIENCESAADVEFTAAPNTDAWFIGGLAGRSRGGIVKGCTVSGSLIDTEVATAQSYSYIGGITSDVNTFNEKVGKVEDCVFSGKILMGLDAGTTGTDVTGITCNLTTGFRIGGIVGRNQDNAEIIGCSTTSDAEIDIRGDMLVLYVGGIDSNAQAPVSGCDNYARISIWSTSTDVSGGKAYVGGISGLSVTELSGNDNYGAINMNAQHRISSYGGILGYNNGGTLTNCTNNGVINEDNYRPRYLYIGGVVGDNSGAVTDVHNTESVTVSNVPNNSNYGQTYCGGVIGYNQFDVDGAKIDNLGSVTVNINKTTYSEIAAGGIAGANEASLSGAKNTGTVTVNCTVAVTSSTFTAIGGVIGAQLVGSAPATVSGCTNEAATVKEGVESVLGIITSSTGSTCLNWCEGGIIGYINGAAVTVTGCTNNAHVHHQANKANTAGRNSFTGGIVGKIVAASGKAVTISDCHNYGPCLSQNYNNTMTYSGGPFLGGIAGATAGVSATEKVNIEKCIVEDKAGVKVADVRIYGYRGCTGGIVGYSSFTTVKDCEVSKLMQNNSNATYCGGLVGWANNSSSIVGGTVSSAIGTGKNIGGIVAVMQNSSSVNGSKYAGTITSASTAYGAVAAVSVSGTSITNAKIASTATVMGAAASTDNKYVCFDENATISGTAIE